MTPLLSPVKGQINDCLMVGVGASAGGLEAISELLAAIPNDSGIAFLIVQHLAPKRPSLLSTLLASRCVISVVEAQENMLVEAGHAYVIPPDTSMSVIAGRIVLSQRKDALGPPMPADDLFESLARDQGSNAVGVILSGNGTDGALGLQLLQDSGGLTFAQNEATAEYFSMPHAAIQLRCVDHVLAPRDIALELVRLAKHLSVMRGDFASAVSPVSESNSVLPELFSILRKACQVDFSLYKRGTIQRRLLRRMALHELTSVEAYLNVLKADPAEALALSRDLLIRVTEFFRDPQTYAALTETVFPRLFDKKGINSKIRIWVAGCSSGEEVYSIAICLLEYLGDRAATTSIQIFGTDVSTEALEIARAARYIDNIARNVSPERLDRFFVRDGDHFCVDKAVRAVCTFARHNVAIDPPFSKIDLVSCRNLLIYLSPTLQKDVMPLFHYALQPNGVLMLGPSETVGAFSELFSVIENKHSKLYGKKSRISLSNLASSPSQPSVDMEGGISGTSIVPAFPDAVLLMGEADRIALKRYAPPAVLCDNDLNIIDYRGDTSAYLIHPDGPPNSNLQRWTRPEVFSAVTDAVAYVRREGVMARKPNLSVEVQGTKTQFDLEIHPVQLEKIEERWFLVVFEAPSILTETSALVSPPSLGNWLSGLLRNRGDNPDGRSYRQKDKEIAALHEELGNARRQLRTMLEEHDSAREELRSSHEELLSNNEEFQSTNVELETAKIELQSLNQELLTTNDELRHRNVELNVVHEQVAMARDYADAIVETMSEPMLVLEPDMRVVRANHAFYDAFHTTAEKTLGLHLYSLGNEQWNIPLLRQFLEEMLPDATKIRNFEITHAFPKIGIRTMRLNASRVEWGDHALMLLTISDITLHHLALDRLQIADQQKDEFLAMLAHELRNPLATIRNGLRIWERGDADADVVLQARVAAQRQLDHEIRLVEDLLDVSRITRGIIALKIERIDLGEAVSRAVSGCRVQLETLHHDITVVLPIKPLVIHGDAMRIEQVVTNLLGNAIKYTLPGGKLHVNLERDGNDAVLTIADNGIGMTAELLPTIFTIFAQAERSLDRKGAGLGLGLALVSRLVDLHHGQVHASSPGLTLGSSFTVRLPALPLGTPADVVATVSPELIESISPLKVLVVDDNIDSAESSAALLTLEGHDVKVATNGPQALKIAEDFLPDAVLLDIGLPEMDGYEVARRLRAISALEPTLLIAHSGYGDAETLRRAAEAGFDRHLIKPSDLTLFSALVASCRAERGSGVFTAQTAGISFPGSSN